MQSEITERAKTAWNSIADEFNQWDALGLDEQETYVALTAALVDVPAVETFTRGQMLAEVERRVERALAARSALVDVPVEPVAKPDWWQDEAAAEREFTEYFCRNYPGPDTVIHDPIWHAPKLFRAAKRALLATNVSPPLSRQGEDRAEVDRLTRPIVGIENRTAQEVFAIMADRIRLAATRSGSATNSKGHADE